MSPEPSCCTPEALLVRVIALEKLVDRVERDLADAEAKAQREADRVLEVALRDKAQANEWRATVTDLVSTMTSNAVTRSEYTTAHTVLADKLESIDRRFNAQEGATLGVSRTTQQMYSQRNQSIIWAFLALSIVISIAAMLLELTVLN